MNTQVQMNDADIDALLDGDIEGLLDRKEFTPLPVGTHLFRFGWERATIEEHDFVGVILKLQHVRPIELANPADAAMFEPEGIFHGEEINKNVRCYFISPKDGSGSNYGQGTAKATAQAFIDAGLASPDANGKYSLAAVFDSVSGYEVIATVKHRKDKNDKSKIFDEFNDIVPNTEVSE